MNDIKYTNDICLRQGNMGFASNLQLWSYYKTVRHYSRTSNWRLFIGIQGVLIGDVHILQNSGTESSNRLTKTKILRYHSIPINTHTYPRTHARSHARTHARTHTTHADTHAHTRTHTRTHAHKHTHTHTHTHTQRDIHQLTMFCYSYCHVIGT